MRVGNRRPAAACVDTVIDGQGDRAIQADRIRVGGAVRLLHDFTSRGEIRLIGARINGSLDITGAHLSAVNGPAIELEDAVIEGGMFVIEDPGGRRPEIRGRIGMGSTRIAGRMEVRNATIEAHADRQRESIYARSATAGIALDATQLSVAADVAFLGGCEVTGSMDMTMGEMSSVTIGAGCVLRAPYSTALDLTDGEIRAHVRLEHDATVEGTIRLEGAAIHGMLALNGQMSKPEHRSWSAAARQPSTARSTWTACIPTADGSTSAAPRWPGWWPTGRGWTTRATTRSVSRRPRSMDRSS